MEVVNDIAREWPNFFDEPVEGASTVHVTCASTDEVAEVIATLPWSSPIFELLLTSLEDKAINRHLGFWKRHSAALSPPGETWEEFREASGELLWVAVSELATKEQLRAALRDRGRAKFHRAYVAHLGTLDVPVLMSSVLSAPGLGTRMFLAKRFMPALTKVSLDHDCIALRAEDDLSGRPGVGFYGATGNIEKIVTALASPEPG